MFRDAALEPQRQLRAGSLECGEKATEPARAPERGALLADEEAQVRAARELVEHRAVDVRRRLADERRVFEARREDPLRGHSQRDIVLPLVPPPQRVRGRVAVELLFPAVPVAALDLQ